MIKTKVLILIPSLIGGGAERALVNLLNNLDFNQYDVDLAVVSYHGVYKNKIPNHVKVIPLFTNSLLVRILAYAQKRIGVTWPFRWAVRSKITATYNTSICYLDSNFTDLLFFVKKSGRKISWVHSSYKTNPNFYRFFSNDKYRRKLILNRYSKLDAIVFVSEDCKKEFEEIFGSYANMPVIYNLIEKEQLLRGKNEFVIEQSRKISFVAVGSLLPVKGYDKLIEAASMLKNEGLDFEVKILGEGMLKEELQSQINESRLGGIVKLLGFYQNPYPFMASADVFIMTSISEALPLALCEAITLGKAVLVTNCSGCREIVDQGKYGLFAEQTSKGIAMKMREVLLNKSLITYYEGKALERSNIFDKRIVIDNFSKILDGNLYSGL